MGWRRIAAVWLVAMLSVHALYGPDTWSFLRWGILPLGAPLGTPRAAVGVYAHQVGHQVHIAVRAQAFYLYDGRGRRQRGLATVHRFRVDAAIAVEGADRVSLTCRWRWARAGEQTCITDLPALPDGEHTLLLTVRSPLPESPTVEVPLPVFESAKAHLLTDRTRYAPEETLLARALTYARADLVPRPHRRGVWQLRRDHDVLLEEGGTTDARGVAALTLTLPPSIVPGDYVLSWTSGDAMDEVVVTVDDVELPWLLVDAEPTRGWFGPGEQPSVRGSVRTAAGRPAGDIEITPTVQVSGGWPLPLAWSELAALRTDARGRFELGLPAVPADLGALGTLRLDLHAHDAVGGTSTGRVVVPLSPDPLLVHGVTEAGGRLFESRSNRVFLRLTTPDGRPLAHQAAHIVSQIDPRDPGRTATTDDDGVLAMQLDPGPPLAIVQPLPPRREEPTQRRAFTLAEGTSVLTQRGLGLAERTAVRALVERMDEACGGLVGAQSQVGRLVSVERGRVTAVTPDASALDGCVAEVLEGRRWPGDGLWSLTFDQVPDPARPRIVVGHDPESQLVDPLSVAFAEAAARAGACVRGATASRASLGHVRWLVEAAERRPQLWFSQDVAPCVRRHIARVTLPEPVERDLQGVVWLSVEVPWTRPPPEPEPETTRGWTYEVHVGDRVGHWQVEPANHFPTRLRPSEPIVDAGSVVTMRLIRGDDFGGVPPDTLTLHGPRSWSQTCARRGVRARSDATCPVAPETGWRFQPPEDHSGFFWVDDLAEAVVYVRPSQPADLSLTADQSRYAPGDRGRIRVRTHGPAVVSLVGVDARLERVMDLPQPDDLQRAAHDMASPRVFGVFTLLDVVSGRIRGEAAALAVMSQARLDEPDEPPLLDPFVTVHHPDLDGEERAAVALVAAEARSALRALPGDRITYEDFVELWDEIVAVQGAQGPWRRPLALSSLSESSLRRVDPRVLIGDATRMPEDLQPWLQWVAEATP